MKKGLHFLAAILSCALVMFSSCSDDDDQLKELEKDQVNTMTIDATAHNKWVYVNLTDGSNKSEVIDPVGGTYNGDVNIVVAGKDQGDIKDLKLKISRINKDSVNIVLKDLAFGKMKIDSVTSGAKVVIDSINGGLGYKLVGGKVSTEVGGMTILASSNGHVIGKNIDIKINVTPGKMPMPILATYKGTIETGTIDETSFDWDIAFHRWDVKTNGGSVLETVESELENLKDIPASGYVEDVETSELIIDNSLMMQGKVGYATDHVNKELGKWMNLDLSNMPPSYTPSNKVYVLKTTKGKFVKIKVTDYTDDSGNKGHITFDYVFPSK